MQKLDDPKPKTLLSRTAHEPPWSVERYIDLPRNLVRPEADLFEILDNRRSRRHFSSIATPDLSMLFWASQRNIAGDEVDSNRFLTPLPTAGGLASVRTLVLNHCFGPWLYEPIGHRAGILEADTKVLDQIVQQAQEFFDIADGLLLLFAADRKLLDLYYENPESLVLQEAGVLIGALALISEALGLSFCPLGTQAGQWTSGVLGVSEDIICPGGAAVLGGRQAATICSQGTALNQHFSDN